MIINYETCKCTTEEQQIEITDTKNVFLQGTNPFDGLDTFLGIWTNKNRLLVVTLTSHRNMSYKGYLNLNLPTEDEIRKFLKSSTNVKVITKDIFKKQINNIKSMVEI